jgi:hypothetical protein
LTLDAKEVRVALVPSFFETACHLIATVRIGFRQIAPNLDVDPTPIYRDKVQIVAAITTA